MSRRLNNASSTFWKHNEAITPPTDDDNDSEPTLATVCSLPSQQEGFFPSQQEGLLPSNDTNVQRDLCPQLGGGIDEDLGQREVCFTHSTLKYFGRWTRPPFGAVGMSL